MALFPALLGANSLHEASTNFDLKDVGAFLGRVAKLVDSGMDASTITELTKFVDDTPVETEREKPLTVGYRGKNAKLIIHVFMDDLDAPDLYFYSADENLTSAIQAEMIEFAKEHGQ